MAGTTEKLSGFIGAVGSGLRRLVVNLNALISDAETIRRASVTHVIGATAGMVIKAGGSALAKNGAAFYFTAPPSGTLTAAAVLGTVAVNTDVAAFAGTVTNAKFNVFVHTVKTDGAGANTLATRMGTEGAALGTVLFPAIPDGEVVYGITIIHPTGTGNFVGGTTALDDATVVPTAVYLSPSKALGVRAIGAAAALTAAKLGNGSGTAYTA